MEYTDKITQAHERLSRTPSINFLVRELPRGKYDVTIQEVELKNRDRAPRIPYFVIRMIINSGRYENYIISDVIGLTEKSTSRALCRLFALAELCEVDIADLDNLEAIAETLDEKLTGKVLHVVAQKPFKQKAIVNYFA